MVHCFLLLAKKSTAVPLVITTGVCVCLSVLEKQSRCLVIWKYGAVFQRETDWRFMMMFSSTWPRKKRCAIFTLLLDCSWTVG